MNAKDASVRDEPAPRTTASLPLSAPITAGVVSWVAIALGFLGLKMLMEERPQFVGQPMTVSKAGLVQESPQVVVRKVADDLSVIKPAQPESTEIHFDMKGRRDYRGLKTISDMSGTFRARYLLTNVFDEAIFVLFKCPHPKTESESLLASGLKLQASAAGEHEQLTNAWLWSGMLEPHGSVNIDLGYQVASLKAATYRVNEKSGNPVKQLRVSFQRQDLPAMRFESRDGATAAHDNTVVWERKDFLAPDHFSAHIIEGRSLFGALSHLVEIGPLISLLFLVSVSAVILVRQRLTALQMLTIAAGYGLYFPLILYLSSRFSFVVALIIAFAVPGALLLNYARWLLGNKLALLGGALFLGLYQVFPTLAAFAGWNRGMVLLCLGIVTLWVLINLQNQALRRNAAAALLVAGFILPCGVSAAEVQVILPAEFAGRLVQSNQEPPRALISFEPAKYQVRQESTYFRVEATLPFQVLRPAETPTSLFAAPVHLLESHLESAEKEWAQLVTVTNRLSLFAQRPGEGTMRFSYRAAIGNREGKRRAQIPLLLGPSGNVRLESIRNDLEVITGGLWTKSAAGKPNVYDIGVAGEEMLVLEWREQDGDSAVGAGRQGEGAKEFYGIGLTHAQNLTVINSDGSCTHFAEFHLPVFQKEEFRMRLPAKARLISVSVNGTEINAPVVEEQLCRLRLPAHEPQQTAHRLSFRLAYPLVRLGFVGSVELALPEVFQTAGTLEWVVALPSGFETQVISSGLETQKAPPELSRFGDYGRIVKSQPHTYLAKNLAPPGVVSLNLKYRQMVPGLDEPGPP